MQLQIQFPETFPLRGVERDAFEAKLRDALHDVFDGRRVRQLAEQINARRPFEPSDVLPLCRIGDEHPFERCMTLDRCRFDEMSAALRRVVTSAIGARLGLELDEPDIAAGIVGQEVKATKRPSPNTPSSPRRTRTVRVARAIATGAGVVVLAHSDNDVKERRPAATAPMMGTGVSTSPAQTLRVWRAACPTAGDRIGCRLRSSRRARRGIALTGPGGCHGLAPDIFIRSTYDCSGY